MMNQQEKPIPQKPEPEPEPDSDSESSSESESDGGDDVEIHPLEAWGRYNSKWKAIDKSGLEEGLVSNILRSCFYSMTDDTFTIACSIPSALASDFRQAVACQQRRGRQIL